MLTTQQMATLKADMFGASNGALATLIANSDWQNVAAYYNAASITNVWRPDASVDAIKGAITWANLTPADAPDGSQVWLNRAMACQGKQFNLQLILGQQSGGTVPADVATFRAGLQDALQNIPAGAGGVTVSGGWSNVINVLRRPGTRFEVLFSSTDGAANKTTVYGQQVTGNDCYEAYTS